MLGKNNAHSQGMIGDLTHDKNEILTVIEADNKFYNKSDLYTNIEVNDSFYNKTDIDNNKYNKIDVYNKTESDVKYLVKGASDIDADNKKIINVSDAINEQDVVNKRYLENMNYLRKGTPQQIIYQSYI